MAKDIAIGKRLKISQAQQHMLLAVLGASIVLGISLALMMDFIKRISFNAQVIGEQNQAIAMYSDTIKHVGICKKPRGTVYSEDELKKCNPNAVNLSDIPKTLRSEILERLAANPFLSEVPREGYMGCINPETKKNFTYNELNKIYDEADGDEELARASDLIKSCSALRVIPDALPAFKNDEALLSSLNKILIMSGWEPKSLSPSEGGIGEADSETPAIALDLSIEANSEITLKVLANIERSIREFNVRRATVEWSGGGALDLQAQALAYYVNPSYIKEIQKVIKPEKEEE